MPLPAGRGFGGGSGLEDAPDFQLNFADLGAGAVSIVAERGGVSGTAVRATAAATKLSSGLWKLDVASGVLRSAYGGLSTTVPNPYLQGYYAEGAATQLALNPRDMTQVSWIATTMTTAQTSTGIDGVGNSCTRITAAGANSTILQTLVAAASSRTYSCWVKRITGTGTAILKHGTATLDITALINSATFTRVELNDNELNVAYGIQINTSGDALDVDCNQFEAGSVATSPIPAAGVRNADLLTYPTTGWYNQNAGTLFAQAMKIGALPGAGGTSLNSFWVSDGTSNERLGMQYAITTGTLLAFVADGGVTQVSMNTGNGISANVQFKSAFAYSTNDFAAMLNAGTIVTDIVGTLPTVTIANIGTIEGGGAELFGPISSIAYWRYAKRPSQLIALTSP